jgi:oligopeptide/dipeptide ABC transporter ATP-binding protein
VADRVAVLYLGHLVEVAPKKLLFSNPRHPYTQALLSAVPMISSRREKTRRIVLAGEIPTAIDVPERCRFATRCFRPIDVCWKEVPRLEEMERDHAAACFNQAPLAEALSG